MGNKLCSQLDCYTTLGFGLFFVGFKYLDVSLGAILSQLGIPLSVLLAGVFLKDSLGRSSWLALVLAFGGVVLISGSPEITSFWPVALVLLAQVGWAIGNLQIKKANSIPPLTILGWSYLYAFPQVLTLSFIFESGHIEAVMSASSLVWLCLACNIFFGSILGYGLWTYLLHISKVSRLLPFHLLDPIFAALAGSLLLGQELSSTTIQGGLLVISGVAMIMFKGKIRYGK